MSGGLVSHLLASDTGIARRDLSSLSSPGKVEEGVPIRWERPVSFFGNTMSRSRQQQAPGHLIFRGPLDAPPVDASRREKTIRSPRVNEEVDLDEGEDLDLRTLPDDELVKQMHDDLYDGLKEEIEDGTHILLERGWGPKQLLDEALVEGMRIVGIDFRDGILFVPEVLLAANAMKGGMEILRPLLTETGAETIGTVVIGTVKGDIHDIGKNLVAMMLEGAGFEVFNIGINNPVENYLEALEEHQPDILGMSALLTTTMPYMKVVIDTLVEKGIRDDYVVLVGGAPLNEQFADAIGADAYCRDAAVAVETAKELVARHRAKAAAV